LNAPDPDFGHLTMTLLIANRRNPDGSWECMFQPSNPPLESQKATTFIGHPTDRRTQAILRRWKVSLPDTASFQDDAVIWFEEGRFRTLTAAEVFDLAHKQLHGFSCVEV
jgi:hypothetical protein